MKKNIPEPTLRRLSWYLRYLERFKEKGAEVISSKELSLALGLSDAQVRRDLFTLGGFGKRGVGYNVENLYDFLVSFFGLDREQKAILVGCGNLGKALLQYKGFRKRKFIITYAFDVDKRIIGGEIGDVLIEDVNDMKRRVQTNKIMFGVIATPAASAQDIVDRMIDAGVKGILNFAPIRLQVPSGIALTPVDFAIELEWLSYHMHHKVKT